MSLSNHPARFGWLLLCLVALLLGGCTTIGAHDEAALKNTDFGPPESLRICVLLDTPEISQAEGAKLMQAVQTEFALYGITVTVPWYHAWQRPGFGRMKIITDLAARKLPPPCDRVMALVGQNAGDVLVGLFVTTEGSVDTVTHTRGYVVSEFSSINQVFMPPEAAMVHESYHLLGCDHDVTMTACYARIQRLKAAARVNRAAGNDFFPTYTVRGQLIMNRDEVDVREANALRVYLAKPKN